MDVLLWIINNAPAYWQVLVVNAPGVVGFIMPFFIQIVTTRLKHDEQKVWASVAMCFVVAAIFSWDSLKYGTLTDIVQSFGIIFAESHVVFITFFRTSPLRYKMMQALGIKPIDPAGELLQTKTTSPELG